MTIRRQLVVNADDLGLSVRVNDGIFDAHERGILTSASVFRNRAATVDAIRRSRTDPTLGIGAHLTLVDGSPTCRGSIPGREVRRAPREQVLLNGLMRAAMDDLAANH